MRIRRCWASASPSMYPWVVWIERWPTSCCTSLREPPALVISLAARVTKVCRPECEEQPSKPALRYKAVNQFTTALAVMCRPLEDLITGPSQVCCCRNGSLSAVVSSGPMGMRRPLPFLAAQAGSSINRPTRPVASNIISHLRAAISPALRPALKLRSTMALFRYECRCWAATRMAWRISVTPSTFAGFPFMLFLTMLVETCGARRATNHHFTLPQVAENCKRIYFATFHDIFPMIGLS